MTDIPNAYCVRDAHITMNNTGGAVSPVAYQPLTACTNSPRRTALCGHAGEMLLGRWQPNVQPESDWPVSASGAGCHKSSQGRPPVTITMTEAGGTSIPTSPRVRSSQHPPASFYQLRLDGRVDFLLFDRDHRARAILAYYERHPAEFRERYGAGADQRTTRGRGAK